MVENLRSQRQKRSRARKQKKAPRAGAMATKPAGGQSASSTLSIFINDFTDSDNEASAEVWAWGLEQNPSVKGIYIAEPRWVNLGYYMTSNDFVSCINLINRLSSSLEVKDPPLTTVLAGRITQDIIDKSKIWDGALKEDEKDLLLRCIRPEPGPRDNRDDSINHARLLAMDYLTTMRARCKRFDSYLDVSCLDQLQIPINLKTHYHEELIARTADELGAFRKIMERPTDDEKVIERRKIELREWYSKALDRKRNEFGGEYPVRDLDYDHLRDEIRRHDKTIAFGGASLTVLQEILKREPGLGKKIEYYQQGGTSDSTLNILGNPYNFALNTKAAKYILCDNHDKLAKLTLIPTDTTKKVEWTAQGLAKLSPAVGVRSLAFHGRYDPWDMISPKEITSRSTKTDEFMAWRSEWVDDPKYLPPKRGHKAVMADLTAFLVAFTRAFDKFDTGQGILERYSVKVSIKAKEDITQMTWENNDQSSIQCLMLQFPPNTHPEKEIVLVENNALALVESALKTISPTT